jgi:hypothetical protein
VSNNTLNIEEEINYIMKTKGPFMKVVLLNEVVKHHLFKPNFDIEILFHFHFIFLNIHIIHKAQLSMIHMPL